MTDTTLMPTDNNNHNKNKSDSCHLDMNNDTTFKINKLIESIQKTHSSKQLNYEIEPPAKNLMMNYADEIVSCILEQAAMIAKHRKSDVIEQSDIHLILGTNENHLNSISIN